MTTPIRLPDAAAIEDVLRGLPPATADADLAPALTRAFLGFVFTTAAVDDPYWRDTRAVLGPNGVRLGEQRPWIKAELAAAGGDLRAVWERLRTSDLQIAEWRGTSVFAFGPTGPGAADYVQNALGRETAWRGGPIVDPHYRPHDVDDLFEPSWVSRDGNTEDDLLAGPVYRLMDRAGGAVVHLRSFLARCARIERERREARRPEMEQRVIREVGPQGARETPFLAAVPDWFDYVPREMRFFRDWEGSSASAHRVYAHWALDIRDYEYRGEREVGFIPRPLHQPADGLQAGEDTSVHLLMDRIEALDREIGLPFGWFFLMTHGHWVAPEVGHAIAAGLRAQRLRLPDRDAQVLLRCADTPYG